VSWFTVPTVTLSFVSALAGLAAGLLIGARCGRRGTSSAPDTTKAEPGQGVELYVGNLPYDLKDRDVVRTFEKHGAVLSIRVIKNKFNGRSRGYGFVEMADDAAADRAVKAMNGFEIKGRKLVVNEAKSRTRD
jgi:RNA recognition motif-containing protein